MTSVVPSSSPSSRNFPRRATPEKERLARCATKSSPSRLRTMMGRRISADAIAPRPPAAGPGIRGSLRDRGVRASVSPVKMADKQRPVVAGATGVHEPLVSPRAGTCPRRGRAKPTSGIAQPRPGPTVPGGQGWGTRDLVPTGQVVVDLDGLGDLSTIQGDAGGGAGAGERLVELLGQTIVGRRQALAAR